MKRTSLLETTPLTALPESNALGRRSYATERWIAAVLGLAHSPIDVKNLQSWGRVLGVSRGSLRQWLRMAGISGRVSLDFARVLRAVVRSYESGWEPENLMDVMDERTLRRLLHGAGLPRRAVPHPTVQSFLRSQRVIGNRPILECLERELTSGVIMRSVTGCDHTKVFTVTHEDSRQMR